MRARLLICMEFLLGAVGTALLVVYAAAVLDGFTHSRGALEEFKSQATEQISAEPVAAPSGSTDFPDQATPQDFALWSQIRIAAFEAARNTKSPSPIAVLRIPKISLEVPVFADTKEESLNRGAGWIEGTAAPGKNGNVGIAGHRDGFFRKLRYVGRGDEVILLTKAGTESFRIDKIEIVRPDETSVLRPRYGRSLTLVTCYPFYFVGNAPQRFIVEGYLESETRGPISPELKSNLESSNNTFQKGVHK